MSTLVGGAPLPNQPFPLIALRGSILLPGLELSLTIGRSRSLALVATLHEGDVVGVVAQNSDAGIGFGRAHLCLYFVQRDGAFRDCAILRKFR